MRHRSSKTLIKIGFAPCLHIKAKVLCFNFTRSAPAAPAPKADPLAASFRAHVAFLADDLLEGRDTGAKGHEVAARYVATQFAGMGLKIPYISPSIPKGKSREAASGNQIILQSPRLFAGFVAHEAFSTLAPPPPPALPQR